MATVKFTSLLQRFYPDLSEAKVDAPNVHELVEQLNVQYPKLKTYLLDEQGQLRKHVNIFVNGKMVSDRKTLRDTVSATDEIHIIQALSGG